ncbi:MAG TPA: CDP-archaeol synthase [Chlamydiales bacterium]|nr:CDP-archaeol synthase [Chlamydiales bacterium]
MKDLSKRFILSLIAVPVLICLFLFAFNPWFQYVVILAVAGITCIAVWEYEQLVKTIGGKLNLPVIILFSLLEVIAFFAAARYPQLIWAPVLIFFIAFFCICLAHFHEKEGAIIDLAVSSFSLLYIAIPMGMILGILYFSGAQDGRWWVAYLFIVTKITDVGAYFAGQLWGRRKLAPAISPGKTVEGTLFGLLCAIAASVGFYLLSYFSRVENFHLGLPQSLILGVILGLIGPLGDLCESLLKRDANKKDSNRLPGFGGVLDMVDSLLFNAPIIYLYLKIL